MDVSLRATSHLSDFLPEGGKINLEDGSKVQDVFSRLGINSDLVMLIVVDGRLADYERMWDGCGCTIDYCAPASDH